MFCLQAISIFPPVHRHGVLRRVPVELVEKFFSFPDLTIRKGLLVRILIPDRARGIPDLFVELLAIGPPFRARGSKLLEKGGPPLLIVAAWMVRVDREFFEDDHLPF